MAYRSKIDKDNHYLPIHPTLASHLDLPYHSDYNIDYNHPPIESLIRQPHVFRYENNDKKSARLPARINSPLIPYPLNVIEYICLNKISPGVQMHNSHRSQLQDLKSVIDEIQKKTSLILPAPSFRINQLRAMCRNTFSYRHQYIHMAARAYAVRATSADLSIAALDEIKYQPMNSGCTKYMSFLVMIQRLRAQICIKGQERHKIDENSFTTDTEGDLLMLNKSDYAYGRLRSANDFMLIVVSGHFMLYTKESNTAYYGSFPYLDYAFTVADTLNNVNIICEDREYSWTVGFLSILAELAESDCDHNSVVGFMKNLEGFILNMSDIDLSYPMNWTSIMMVLHDLWIIDQNISQQNYDFQVVASAVSTLTIPRDTSSYLQRVIRELVAMTPSQMQEVSALHKFVFYAEINTVAGIEKFLKRVHTPRNIVKEANSNITRLAKCLFWQSYTMKHKSLPNMYGDEKKITFLRNLFKRGKQNEIKNYQLDWWDGVIIGSCMDNTKTDDALEFAKDKGALKPKVTYGPGDSRRELLQVIEEVDYTLKDLTKEFPFIPKIPKVYRTTQASYNLIGDHHVRLMPKEREQKDDGRMFANGQLANKHALSVLTTKMKKILHYFDEQMMTPRDSKRKQILHEAGQKLTYPSKYSLLIDIEGHNQSMQKENTGELLEFCGLLFGEKGWGTLADYFSHISIFYYDEYNDDVIVSEGQLGGIEGWMNPLWTLHTTLMMKLLRYMTDLTIDTIMVYSDDVDIITDIPQATEVEINVVFIKVVEHCRNFGMNVKFTQTAISKNRVTMLRQHYHKGYRADSTLKKLLVISGANNSQLLSESEEIAGICSSASSALEMSNHSNSCCYLKNYKCGLLLVRLPQAVLKSKQDSGALCSSSLPSNLAELLYGIKDNSSLLESGNIPKLKESVINDIAKYLKFAPYEKRALSRHDLINEVYGLPTAESKFVDMPEKMLYLQIYDQFMQDLLFFWIFMPSNLGGLGAILHIDLMLSGHSNGVSKALHYLETWIISYSSDPKYFSNYLNIALGISDDIELNLSESRCVSSCWQFDRKITTAKESITSSIKSMIKHKTANKNVIKLMKFDATMEPLKDAFVGIFRDNFHSRIVQFYFENSAIHFMDLLINKIETSSSLLSNIRSMTKLRVSLAKRTITNIRIMSSLRTTYGPTYGLGSNIIETLTLRRSAMYPKISFIEAEEILYDRCLEESHDYDYLFSIQACSPSHYENGLRLFDSPKYSNETRYKGDFLDAERLVGNKEELLAAKVVAITKWFISKHGYQDLDPTSFNRLDVILACRLTLSTLISKTFEELIHLSPTETGGEFLHRIPNTRFSTMTYLRSETNLSLQYSSELRQAYINGHQLMDSNINFDYMRMRYLVAATIRSKYSYSSRFMTRYKLVDFTGILDVQFVKPKESNYAVDIKIENYGSFRGHKFSDLKFRYMAMNYLTTENVEELGLIPASNETFNLDDLTDMMMDDIILSYASSIDRERMLMHKSFFNAKVWDPLLTKVTAINPRLRDLTYEEKMEYIAARFEIILSQSGKIRSRGLLTLSERALQSGMEELLEQNDPSEEYVSSISKLIARTDKGGLQNIHLKYRRDRYLNLINRNESIRSIVYCHTLSLYIVRYHFFTTPVNGIIEFDYLQSLTSFTESGIMTVMSDLDPDDLWSRISLYGIATLIDFFRTNYEKVVNYIIDLLSNVQSVDIIAPSKLPSLGAEKLSLSDHNPPHSREDCIYDALEICETVLYEFHDMIPLLDYARKSSDISAHPDTYYSPTGSDSYMAQYGLMSLMKKKFSIDPTIRICNLTAGRGDGHFAMTDLGLNVKSFALKDTFTSVLCHPEVELRTDYDLTDNETIKEFLDYDLIIIDVSFTGEGKINMTDVMLLLEEKGIAYIIRLNSVTIENYESRKDHYLPSYQYFLCSPVSPKLRPYQNYLLSIPGIRSPNVVAQSAKKSEAYRNIALSYSKSMVYDNFVTSSWTPIMNSITRYVNNREDISNLLTLVSDDTYTQEVNYYIDSLTSEYDQLWSTFINLESLGNSIREFIMLNETNVESVQGRHYIGPLDELIGKVNQKSHHFLSVHLKALQSQRCVDSKITFTKTSGPSLELLRRVHPVYSERRKMNLLLGIIKWSPEFFDMPKSEIDRKLKTMQTDPFKQSTNNQKELHLAIKLLILASSKNNRAYGVHYCLNMMSNWKTDFRFHSKVLSIYRKIVPWFEIAKQLISYGVITLRNISAIECQIIERKRERYKRGGIKEKRLTIGDSEIPSLGDPETIFNDLMKGLIQNSNFMDNIITDNENEYIDIYDQDLSSYLPTIDIGNIIERRLNELNYDENTALYYDVWDEADYDN